VERLVLGIACGRSVHRGTRGWLGLRMVARNKGVIGGGPRQLNRRSLACRRAGIDAGGRQRPEQGMGIFFPAQDNRSGSGWGAGRGSG
jgi:hypothetical protein